MHHATCPRVSFARCLIKLPPLLLRVADRLPSPPRGWLACSGLRRLRAKQVNEALPRLPPPSTTWVVAGPPARTFRFPPTAACGASSPSARFTAHTRRCELPDCDGAQQTPEPVGRLRNLVVSRKAVPGSGGTPLLSGVLPPLLLWGGRRPRVKRVRWAHWSRVESGSPSLFEALRTQRAAMWSRNPRSSSAGMCLATCLGVSFARCLIKLWPLLLRVADRVPSPPWGGLACSGLRRLRAKQVNDALPRLPPPSTTSVTAGPPPRTFRFPPTAACGASSPSARFTAHTRRCELPDCDGAQQTLEPVGRLRKFVVS
jgi:hypothetical protein